MKEINEIIPKDLIEDKNAPTSNEIFKLVKNNIPKKMQHTNTIINPNIFKNQKVLEDFDLNKDVYQRNEKDLIKIDEKTVQLCNGCTVVLIIIILILVSIGLIVAFSVVGKVCYYLIPIPCLIIIACLSLTCTFLTIEPNNAAVLTYYGKYIGTCKESGFFWVKPCTSSKKVSLKSNQYNGSMIKVNEKNGNPVLIGCICVWKIRDTAKVIFGVNNYQGFVSTQVESAVRYVSCRYPYEGKTDDEPSLKNNNEEINQLLKLELERRIKMAGIEIEDARITEISYGQEIASVMLKKQAADITVAAKEKIATGAVDIIEKSIRELEKRNVCDFKADEKTKLVGNMMVVLNMDGHNGSTLIKI